MRHNSTEEIRLAAVAYNYACAQGDPPAVAVEQRLRLSRSTCGRRIAEARAAGLIPEARPGGHSERNQKAVRVADALGVTYEDLVATLLSCADGDLRVRTA